MPLFPKTCPSRPCQIAHHADARLLPADKKAGLRPGLHDSNLAWLFQPRMFAIAHIPSRGQLFHFRNLRPYFANPAKPQLFRIRRSAQQARSDANQIHLHLWEAESTARGAAMQRRFLYAQFAQLFYLL